jgi:hypothetical protein
MGDKMKKIFLIGFLLVAGCCNQCKTETKYPFTDREYGIIDSLLYAYYLSDGMDTTISDKLYKMGCPEEWLDKYFE